MILVEDNIKVLHIIMFKAFQVTKRVPTIKNNLLLEPFLGVPGMALI
jgi:hypothetical protein